MVDKNVLYYGLVFSLLLQLGWLTSSCTQKQSFSLSKTTGSKSKKRQPTTKKQPDKPQYEYHFIKVQKAFPLQKVHLDYDYEELSTSIFYRIWTSKSNIYELVPSHHWDAHRMFGRLVVGKRFKIKISTKKCRTYPIIVELTKGPLPGKGQLTH